jgi:hypothetical protein
MLTRLPLLLLVPRPQAFVQHDDPDEAFLQLQQPLAAAFPWALPPVLQPLVVAAPFGSGKRAVLQRLVRTLPDLLAVPAVVTSKPRAAGDEKGANVVGMPRASRATPLAVACSRPPQPRTRPQAWRS